MPNWALAANTAPAPLDTLRQNLTPIRPLAEVWIMALAFSPDRRTIAGSGIDGNIRLWDFRSGSCHDVLRSPRTYEGMNISGVTGTGDADKTTLKLLGTIKP